jgi:hypothetical protein
MGYPTKASDWEVSEIGSAMGAGIVAAGVFVFDLRSAAASLTTPFSNVFVFTSILGYGAGGKLDAKAIFAKIVDAIAKARGKAAGPIPIPPPTYTKISCSKAFSSSDLDMCLGTLTTAGVTGLIGTTVIDACRFRDVLGTPFFFRQSVPFTGGALSTAHLAGVWQRLVP